MSILFDVSVGLVIWIHFNNMISVTFMCAFQHVPGVSTFLNWAPTLFSTLSSLIFISALSWTWLTGSKLRWKFGIAAVLQLVSVLILTIINAQAVAETQDDDKNNVLGTEQDIKYMTDIVASLSTSYNWLVTVTIVILCCCQLSTFEIFQE